MHLEKIFYIVTSTVLVTVFVLITFIFSPASMQDYDSDGGKVIYYADYISPALRILIDRFNEANKGKIRVEAIDLPFEKFSTNERKELLARYLRSKSSRIDLFSADIIWIPRFSKWVKPLNTLIDSSLVRNLLPHTQKFCYQEDSLVAIPLYTDIGLLYYREDLLKKLDTYEQYAKELSESITWERFYELRSEIDRLPGRDGKPFFLFQAEEYEGLVCFFTELLGSGGHYQYLIDGNLNTGQQIIRNAVSFLTGLVHQSRISPPEVVSMKEDISYEYFLKNDAFAVRGWPGFMRSMQSELSDRRGIMIKAAGLPHHEGRDPAYIIGGWNLMISEYSQKVPETVKFIEFLLQPESQKTLYEVGGYIPVNSTAYADPQLTSEHPELSFYQELFRHGVQRPMLQNYTEVSDILAQNLRKAIRFNVPADSVIAEIQNDLRKK